MNKRGLNQFSIIILLVLVTSIVVCSFINFDNEKEKIKEESLYVNVSIRGTLEKMIIPIVENTTIENGDCLSYALYYKEYIKKIYPELDIRKIDMAGICPIGTKECGKDEGMPHTYLIINGHGGECILDQHELVCIQIRDE